MTEFGLPHHRQRQESSPDATIRSLSWFGRPSQRLEGFRCFFVPSGVKLNSQRYIADILEGCLLPCVKKHFQGIPWSLLQDSVPSHASKITQSWKIPSFFLKSKEVWPARSPDLNPLNFSIWSILETKGCSFPHPTVEALKTKLVKELAAIPQETIRAACASFSARLRAVDKNKGHYIE